MAGQLLQLGLLWAANVVALHAVALRAYRARVGQIRAIRQHVFRPSISDRLTTMPL
jgi:hypothetical protein